jgi:hypothetical protein
MFGSSCLLLLLLTHTLRYRLVWAIYLLSLRHEGVATVANLASTER